MRIFTLGKNGITLFYFAFILFSGTYSYGQQVDSCGVTDQNEDTAGNQQYFCDSQEAELSSLLIAGENITFYSDAGYTNELNATTLLIGGTTYYINVDGCQSSVTVTIFNQPQILGVEEDALTRRPEASTKQSLGTLGICVADVENPNVFVSDLRTNAPAGTIQWYRSATGTGEPQPIAESEELQNNTYYYAERVYNDPVNADLNCTTNRARTLVLLTAEEAPEAESAQEFCASENPTVGDIVASGDNRYYATATSEVEISRNAPLEERTYYVSTLGQSCESELRSPVTVTLLTAEAGEDSTDNVFCLSEIEERLAAGATPRQLFLELLEPGVPTNGTFSDDSISEISAAFSTDPTQTFRTTYTVTNELGCEDSVDLSITIEEDFNAGEDNTGVTLCRSALPATLTEEVARNFFLGLLSEDADTNGIFSDQSIAEITAAFNGGDGTGTYSTTYSGGTGECADSSQLEVTIFEGGNAGDDADLVFCQSEIQALVEEFLQNPLQNPEVFLAEWIGDRDTNGTFSGDPLTSIISQFQTGNFPIEVSTTYTIGEGTECEDSAEISLTINEGVILEEDSYSGEICNTGLDESIDDIGQVRALFLNLLDPDVSRDGTFTPNLSQIINQYENDPIGPFTTTYTVGEGECQDSAELTITVAEGVYAGEDATVTLNPEDEAVNIFNFIGGNPDEGGSWTPGNGIFDPATDSPGSFTYTVSNGACEDSAVVTITVTDPTDPEDGECPQITNPDQSFCPGEATVADLFPSTVTWYATADSTEALSGDTELEDGEDYFAGNADGTCDSRTEVIVSLDGQIAGSDNNGQVCNAGLDESIDDIGQVRALFLNLLDPGVARDGTFSPSIGQIIRQYENNNIGDFTTTYTVGEGDCIDSAVLTLTVLEPSEAFAGEDVDLTFCTTDESQNLYNFLTDGANEGGIFEGLENGIFNPSEMDAGEYSFTYVVDDSAECVIEGSEDSAIFTIEVVQGPSAGTDVTLEYCITEIEEMTEAEVLAIFDSLVSEDADEDGTFSPDLDTIIANFLANPIGTFETTYTVSNDLCEDSAEITITVNDTVEADAGEDTTITFCATTDEENLFEYLADNANPNGAFTGYENGIFSPSEAGVGTFTLTYVVNPATACVIGEDEATYTIVVVDSVDAGTDNSTEICQAQIDEMLPNVSNVRDLFLSLLDEGVSREGTFTPSIQALADRYNSGDQFGDFTTIYTITAGDCEDSVELTVTVQEGEAPNAGEDMDLAFCTTEGAQDLTEYLADGVNTTGSFEDLEDGIFDPSELEAGEYTYTYTVTTTGECGGTDTATITVTLSDSPEAPEVDNAVYCVSEGATVADLDAERDLNWYLTADLGTPALADDVLVEGPYYVTQTNEGGCESEATEITVTLEDTAAPTLGQDGNVFCEFDNPTIADLENNITETGDIIWYDAATGGQAYSSAELLEDGMTYYASLTDATSACESSQRLAVTVTLESCELLIPEAFSPNGDGINDRFEIENLSAEYPNFGMEIYNRWGNKVFTGNSSNSSWDGTSDDGSLGDGVLPVGVYFYILNFNDGQTAPIQGRVYLSR